VQASEPPDRASKKSSPLAITTAGAFRGKPPWETGMAVSYRSEQAMLAIIGLSPGDVGVAAVPALAGVPAVNENPIRSAAAEQTAPSVRIDLSP